MTTQQSQAIIEVLERHGLRSPKRPHGVYTMYHRDIKQVCVEVRPHDDEKLWRVACALRHAGFEVNHQRGYLRMYVTPRKQLKLEEPAVEHPLLFPGTADR